MWVHVLLCNVHPGVGEIMGRHVVGGVHPSVGIPVAPGINVRVRVHVGVGIRVGVRIRGKDGVRVVGMYVGRIGDNQWRGLHVMRGIHVS